MHSPWNASSDDMDQALISNINSFLELAIVIPGMTYHLSVAKSVLSTIELSNSVSSDSVHWLTLPMCTVARKGFPIELVQWFCWMVMNSITNNLSADSATGLLKFTVHIDVLQRNISRIFPTNGMLELIFRHPYKTSNMIGHIWPRWPQIKISSILKETLISGIEVFTDFTSNITVGTWMLGNLMWQTSKRYLIATLDAGW